jgi:DNA-binding NarL/FixJ family response regulator
VTITVLIADDQPLMRAALRTCLEAEPDIRVIAEASDGAQAVQLTRRLNPDVVLLDVRMPHVDGIEATRQLVDPLVAEPVKVLMMTTFDLDEYLVEALRAGASGFLLKDAAAEEVVHAVRVIAAGEALLAPAATRRLLDRYARALPPAETDAKALTGVTTRELAVLRLASRGHSNAEIARALHVAPSSVKTHIGHLLTKLGVGSRVHLVIFAYENGLIQPGRVVEEPGGGA